MSLPYAVEIDSDGFDFRVGNRGFVWSYPEYVPGRRRVIRTDIAVLYVGDEAEKQALLLSEPEVFSRPPRMTGRPWSWYGWRLSTSRGCASWSPTPGTCGPQPSWRSNIRSRGASTTGDSRAMVDDPNGTKLVEGHPVVGLAQLSGFRNGDP